MSTPNVAFPVAEHATAVAQHATAVAQHAAYNYTHAQYAAFDFAAQLRMRRQCERSSSKEEWRVRMCRSGSPDGMLLVSGRCMRN